MLQIKVHHNVFQHICKFHETPERCCNEAYQTMAKLLGGKEEKDREDEVKVTSQRVDY